MFRYGYHPPKGAHHAVTFCDVQPDVGTCMLYVKDGDDLEGKIRQRIAFDGLRHFTTSGVTVDLETGVVRFKGEDVCRFEVDFRKGD